MTGDLFLQVNYFNSEKTGQIYFFNHHISILFALDSQLVAA